MLLRSRWFLVLLFAVSGFSQKQWGLPGDVPVPADYDGDGITDVAVWRPANGVWYILLSSTGKEVDVQWGLKGDVPFSDGTRLVVWRPSNGIWYSKDNALRPVTNQVADQPYVGVATELPSSCQTVASPKSSLILLLIADSSLKFYGCDLGTSTYGPLDLWLGLNTLGN